MNAYASNNAGVVLVSDDLLQNPGAMVWWRLGGTIPYSKLVAAWSAAGLDPDLLSESCGPRKALRRAVDAQLDRGRIRRKAPQGGWLIKVSKQDYARNDEDLVTDAKVHLDALGRLVIDPPDHRRAPEIRVSYDGALETVTSQDMTSLLTSLIDHCNGTAMREGGGIYFVPPSRVAEWLRMVEVIQGTSAHRIYKADAMRTEDIVDSVLAGMKEEVAQAADKLDADLAKDGDKALGTRALKSRAALCETVAEKVGRYEKMMGVKLDDIRARMEGLQAGIAAAILASEVED